VVDLRRPCFRIRSEILSYGLKDGGMSQERGGVKEGGKCPFVSILHRERRGFLTLLYRLNTRRGRGPKREGTS